MCAVNVTTAPRKKSLDNIKNACKKGENVMPHCIEAVKNLATLQEICDVYREVYGEYQRPGIVLVRLKFYKRSARNIC